MSWQCNLTMHSKHVFKVLLKVCFTRNVFWFSRVGVFSPFKNVAEDLTHPPYFSLHGYLSHLPCLTDFRTPQISVHQVSVHRSNKPASTLHLHPCVSATAPFHQRVLCRVLFFLNHLIACFPCKAAFLFWFPSFHLVSSAALRAPAPQPVRPVPGCCGQGAASWSHRRRLHVCRRRRAVWPPARWYVQVRPPPRRRIEFQTKQSSGWC